MTTKEALLAAVLAAPDDDLPRLVLADWSDENGQPERAEFIRQSVAEGDDGRYSASALMVRDYRPYTDVPDEWPERVTLVICRGFISEVHCTLADWCGGECHQCAGTGRSSPLGRPSIPCRRCGGSLVTGIGPQIVRRHPVERVVLTDREPRGPLHDAPDLYVWRVTGVPISDGADIPADITRHLAGGKTAATWQRIYYPTREDAFASLSVALIAWAKSHPPK